jgi:hypothetical protein
MFFRKRANRKIDLGVFRSLVEDFGAERAVKMVLNGEDKEWKQRKSIWRNAKAKGKSNWLSGGGK